MNVVDSSGWIEYFLSSAQGLRYSDAIEGVPQLIVPSLCLFEVHKFLSSRTTPDLVEQCLGVMRRGSVVALTDARAIAASVVSKTHKLAMADAVMYSTALEHKATFWTQDVDYKGLPAVQYLPKVV
jgi:predicted nucleic acid-binding protein